MEYNKEYSDREHIYVEIVFDKGKKLGAFCYIHAKK